MKSIIYCRVSTEYQKESGLGIEGQLDKCNKFAESKSLEVVETFVDDGKTATNLNRDGFKAAMDYLKENPDTILIIYKLDRLTRSVRDLNTILKQKEEIGFEISSVVDSFDTSTPSGRLALNMMISIAQWEVEEISERTKRALEQKKNKKEKLGGTHQPFGYYVIEMEGVKRLVPDKKQQTTLQLIFDLRNDGWKVPAICKELKRRKRKNISGSTDWKTGQIYNLLRNAKDRIEIC